MVNFSICRQDLQTSGNIELIVMLVPHIHCVFVVK